MREYCDRGLQAVLDAGVHYGDIRIVDTESEQLVVRNGVVEKLTVQKRLGYGIRVLYDGAWGFASGSTFDQETVQRTAKRAVENARACLHVNRHKVILAASAPVIASWQGECLQDPRTVSLDEKISYLLDCDRTMGQVAGITLRESNFHCSWVHKWFASTDGSFIEQHYPIIGQGIAASAMRGDEVQIRSYPNSSPGQWEGRGWEAVSDWKMRENAGRIAEEAVALLDAPVCGEGRMTVIIDSTQLALQIHESCGHAVELDRVLGSEINDYGTSFLTTDKMGTYRYGSPQVTIVADPTIPRGLGSFGYDDEGVPALKTNIVKDGIFKNYLTSRETAPVIGQNRSNGSMRAEDFDFIPLIRMTNINLEPGRTTLEEMIGETENGLFIAVNRSFSIDDRRWQFQFGTEIGWLIRHGKLTTMVKNPVYSGLTPLFWQSCDAIADEQSWVLWGIANCGKGQPDQAARVSHGCSAARFQNIQVGRIHDEQR